MRELPPIEREERLAAAREHADALVRMAQAGVILDEELQILAEAIERCGLEVRLPRRRPDAKGTLTLRWKKCGKRACKCESGLRADRHGPYLVHRHLERGRVKERSLGLLDDPVTRERAEALGLAIPREDVGTPRLPGGFLVD